MNLILMAQDVDQETYQAIANIMAGRRSNVEVVVAAKQPEKRVTPEKKTQLNRGRVQDEMLQFVEAHPGKYTNRQIYDLHPNLNKSSQLNALNRLKRRKFLSCDARGRWSPYQE